MRCAAPIRSALAAALLALPALPAAAEMLDTGAGRMEAQMRVSGLDTPWAFGFLPDGTILVTERGGRLLSVREGRAVPVSGLPSIEEWGQGGLLDLLVPRDFAQSREIFLTYAHSGTFQRGAGTAVLRLRLSADATRAEDAMRIFTMEDTARAGQHFGSRLVEARDGTLFLTIGDRGTPQDAQDLGSHAGKVLRIARDGSVPPGNPFAGEAGALPEIWSYGHRNPQGAALDGAGQLWVNEHGARGGDEVNRVEPGANYGWPVIAYGVNYNGSPIGTGTAAPGMAQPVLYWDPSIAPSGMTFHDGAVPEWRGDAFVGSLKFNYIARLSGDPLAEVERIAGDSTLRVRDVRQGPDGLLWFLSEGNGALYRLAPAAGG